MLGQTPNNSSSIVDRGEQSHATEPRAKRFGGGCVSRRGPLMADVIRMKVKVALKHQDTRRLRWRAT